METFSSLRLVIEGKMIGRKRREEKRRERERGGEGGEEKRRERELLPMMRCCRALQWDIF